jgi:hypothetical protein
LRSNGIPTFSLISAILAILASLIFFISFERAGDDELSIETKDTSAILAVSVVGVTDGRRKAELDAMTKAELDAKTKEAMSQFKVNVT